MPANKVLRAALTAQRLKNLVRYDPDTGAFERMAYGGNGSFNSYGYLRMSIDGKTYTCHRLAWLYVHGEWPDGHIDHINGVRNDNRIANLRVVSIRTNTENQRRAIRGSKSGILGVQRIAAQMGERYAANIKSNGKFLRLGTFDTPEEAYAAYVTAKRQLHAGCTL